MEIEQLKRADLDKNYDSGLTFVTVDLFEMTEALQTSSPEAGVK